MPRSKPHRHIPTGSPHACPAPSRLGSEDSHGRSSARAAKTFPIAASTPREIQAHPRFAFPLALPLSRRRHPYHKARQGGGAQHEDEDSHGKEHLREVARGNPRVPEAQGRRDPRGELGARLGQHRLHRHGRREARLRGHHHQVRGYDVPKEEPDQKSFERIAEAYLAEAEVEGLTSIRYDIVSLLVTGSEKTLLRQHKNVLNDGR